MMVGMRLAPADAVLVSAPGGRGACPDYSTDGGANANTTTTTTTTSSADLAALGWAVPGPVLAAALGRDVITVPQCPGGPKGGVGAVKVPAEVEDGAGAAAGPFPPPPLPPLPSWLSPALAALARTARAVAPALSTPLTGRRIAFALLDPIPIAGGEVPTAMAGAEAPAHDARAVASQSRPPAPSSLPPGLYTGRVVGPAPDPASHAPGLCGAGGCTAAHAWHTVRVRATQAPGRASRPGAAAPAPVELDVDLHPRSAVGGGLAGAAWAALGPDALAEAWCLLGQAGGESGGAAAAVAAAPPPPSKRARRAEPGSSSPPQPPHPQPSPPPLPPPTCRADLAWGALAGRWWPARALGPEGGGGGGSGGGGGFRVLGLNLAVPRPADPAAVAAIGDAFEARAGGAALPAQVMAVTVARAEVARLGGLGAEE